MSVPLEDVLKLIEKVKNIYDGQLKYYHHNRV